MSASLHASEIISEQFLEEEHLTGVSDGAAVPNESNSQPFPMRASEPVNAVPPASQQTSNLNPSDARRPARKEPLFGIPQPSAAPLHANPNYDDDNYETRFPPDPVYQETSPNARVYRVFIEESAKYDAYMTDEAREGLDVLLVFAGLFSAVLTTFVAQTSQSLQPDRATETTLLLREVAALQRAQISGASVDSIPSTPGDFVPSSLDVWVNGFWFTSLTLSLMCALLAVLMKQWIRHYMSFVSGTAKERSLIRQYRFMGLQKWHVPTLMGILPVLMHLSLAIFFVGLTLFLIPLRRSIAGIVGSLSALVFVAYVTTAVWPVFNLQCPYRTPLSNFIYDTIFSYLLWKYRHEGFEYVSLKEQEHREVTERGANPFEAPAFEWLLNISSNPSVHRVVAQAVGGLLRQSSSTPEARNLVYNKSLQLAWDDMFSNVFSHGGDIHPEKVDLLERLFHLALHIQDPSFFKSRRSASHMKFYRIQLYPAPTLQWESVAIAFLRRSGYRDYLAEKACAVVNRLMSEPPDSDKTRLPVIVWEDLLAAASWPPGVSLFNLSNPVDKLNKTITEELTMRVRSGWKGPSLMYNDIFPISFNDAIRAIEGYVWFLLSPFDKYKGEGDTLDSEKVQRLLSLLNAIVSRGLLGVKHDMLFGICKELICELQSRSTNILVDLIELDVLQVIHNLGTIGRHFWSNNYDANPSVASLIASLIRTSFELRPGAGDHSPWLKYLCLPANSAAIVFLFACQGTTQSLTSAGQVRSDILLFFSRRSLDNTTLRECKTSLSDYSFYFSPYWPNRNEYDANTKVASAVIDELILTSYASSNSAPQTSSSTASPSRGRGRGRSATPISLADTLATSSEASRGRSRRSADPEAGAFELWQLDGNIA